MAVIGLHPSLTCRESAFFGGASARGVRPGDRRCPREDMAPVERAHQPNTSR
jgi:hypothetical protein